MRYQVDANDGLIVIKVPEGATDELLDGESLYEQVEQHFASTEQKWLVLHDLRGTPGSSVRRRRFAAWVKAHQALIEAHVRGYALVAGSSLLEGMITAVLWLVEPPVDFQAFSDPAKAEAWLRSLP